jgi:hypothetical protein
MSDEVIDLEERREQAEVARIEAEEAELSQRVISTLGAPDGAFFVTHAAEMLAGDVLSYKGEENDHVWHLRQTYGTAILQWARFVVGEEAAKELEGPPLPE